MASSNFRFSPRPNKAHDIRWREWGDAAFQEAQQEQKPILLSLSAVWCHWCHVMDETSYSDAENIRLINERYIPVRVDNDMRPDINQRYNLGGWPTTAFLTPEGDLLTGGTYISPEQLRQTLEQVALIYKSQREEIYQRIAEHRAGGSASISEVGPVALPPAAINEVLEAVSGSFDPLYGGFGSQPKFLHPEALDLLLHQYQLSGEERLWVMTQQTLNAMRLGGIFDREEGGFFRYSTTRDWSLPHFEKMLEDNAALLRIYLHAYWVSKGEAYKDAAQRILHYLNKHLYDPKHGTFGGSQDADEHYYSLPIEGRRLLEPPFIDRAVYTNWNAMAASAYLETSWILEKAECLRIALRVLEFLWRRCRTSRGGMYHYWDGAPHGTGLLTDQVYTARALLDAHEVTGDPLYLRRAMGLAHIILRHYAAPEDGGFYDTWGVEKLGQLSNRRRSILENAVVGNVFTRLFLLTEEEIYRRAAYQALLPFAQHYQSYGLFAAGYARAVERLLRFPLLITIVGDPHAPETSALLEAALRLVPLEKVIRPLHPMRDARRLILLGYPAQPAPRAYLCLDQVCSAPAAGALEMRGALERLMHSQKTPVP